MLLLALLTVTAPFVDVHKRFSVELPQNFQFSPMPGDLEGVAFAVQQSGSTGYAVVRIFPKSQNATTQTVARDALLALAKMPGYRVLKEEPCVLSGMPALCRRSVHDFTVQGGGKSLSSTKMQDDALLVHGNHVFMVHCEALAEVFGSFETPFVTFRSAVQFAGVTPSDPELSLIVSPLLGRWRMQSDKSVLFELRADGTFALAQATGTFRIEGSALLIQAQGGVEERFAWELAGNGLVLRSGAFNEPIRYEKVRKTKAQP